jgi:hypothetical protein
MKRSVLCDWLVSLMLLTWLGDQDYCFIISYYTGWMMILWKERLFFSCWEQMILWKLIGTQFSFSFLFRFWKNEHIFFYFFYKTTTHNLIGSWFDPLEWACLDHLRKKTNVCLLSLSVLLLVFCLSGGLNMMNTVIIHVLLLLLSGVLMCCMLLPFALIVFISL